MPPARGKISLLSRQLRQKQLPAGYLLLPLPPSWLARCGLGSNSLHLTKHSGSIDYH